MTVVKEDKAIAEVGKKCAPILEEAKAIIIADEKGLEVAKDKVRSIKDLIKEVKETFDPICSKTNEAHKEATGKRKKHLDPLEIAKRTVENIIGDYATLLMKQAQEAEQKRIDDRNKEIEKINKRLLKHLEGLGDINAQIKDLEDRLAGEMSDIQAEVLQGHLEALERKRDTKTETVERNQTAIEEVETMPAGVAASAVSLKGVGGGRTERIPTVFNKEALVKAAAAENAPIDIFDVNLGKLKKYVNNFPNSRLSGVSIEIKPVVRVR